jgi:prephenate dehydratase
MIAGFQGMRGAYSELALYQYFGRGLQSTGFDTFDDVFEALTESRIDYAFVPVENTIAGTVVENFDLLLSQDCFVIAEAFMKIKHTLLGKRGVNIKDIKQAYSHPHALKQCKEFLKFQGIRAIPKYDTAGSAQLISESDRTDIAAIASELCAEIYDLEILAKDIQTNNTNTTRFLIVVKKENIPDNLECEKTTLAFKTRHYPGALVDCLKIFQEYNLNLTKLESRPVPENPWEYVFYAGFEGGIYSRGVKNALEKLEKTALFVKVLGSYARGI